MELEWTGFTLVLHAGLTGFTVLAAVMLVLGRHRRRTTRLVRERILCPVDGRAATVDFVVGSDDGDSRLDVAHCALIGPGVSVECGKVCRSTAVAPFGEWRYPAQDPSS
jgi:hypothetical protein